MSDKVVPFHPKGSQPCKPLHVFECRKCDSRYWLLFCDGTMGCAICRTAPSLRHFDPSEPAPGAA